MNKKNNKLYFTIIIFTLVSLVMFIYTSLNSKLQLNEKMSDMVFHSEGVLKVEKPELSLLPFPIQPASTTEERSGMGLLNKFEDIKLSSSYPLIFSNEIQQLNDLIEEKSLEVNGNFYKVKNQLNRIEESNHNLMQSITLTHNKLNVLGEKVDSVLHLKSRPKKIQEKIMVVQNEWEEDIVGYQYNGRLNLKKDQDINIKVNERLNFNVDIYSKLLKEIPKEVSDSAAKKENTEDITGIITTTPMTYVVVEFDPTLGNIYKGNQIIYSDTISISMVNKNNGISKSLHSYSFLISDSIVKNKSEVIVNAHFKYYDESFTRFPTYQSASFYLTVHPANSVDYFFQKLQEFFIFGIDKIFYLCTSIVGLLVTMILTYMRKRFNLPESEESFN